MEYDSTTDQHDVTGRDDTGRDATAELVVLVPEAAAMLGISEGAVRKRIERGQLTGWKDAGQWRVILGRRDTTVRPSRRVRHATRLDTTHVAVTEAARGQLEAIRDEWLAPLVAQLTHQAETIGQLRERVTVLEAERDALRSAQPVAELQQASPVIDTNGGAPEPRRRAWWAFWRLS